MRLAMALALLVVAACGSFGSDAAPVVVPPDPTDAAAPPGDDGGTTGADGGDAGESEAGADAGRNCDDATPFGDPALIDGMLSTSSSAGGGGEIVSATLSPSESQMFYTLNYPNLLMQRVMRVTRPVSGSFDSAVEALAPSGSVKSYFSPTVSRAGDQMYLGATLLDGSFRLMHWKVDANGLSDSLVVTAPLPAPPGSPFFPKHIHWSDASSELWFANYPGDSEAAGNLMIWPASSTSVLMPPSASPVSGSNRDAHPVLSADALTLYFASNRSAENHFEIYAAHRPSKTAAFGAASRLAEFLPAVTAWPAWISPDSCRLYLVQVISGTPRLAVASRAP